MEKFGPLRRWFDNQYQYYKDKPVELLAALNEKTGSSGSPMKVGCKRLLVDLVAGKPSFVAIDTIDRLEKLESFGLDEEGIQKILKIHLIADLTAPWAFIGAAFFILPDVASLPFIGDYGITHVIGRELYGAMVCIARELFYASIPSIDVMAGIEDRYLL